TPLKRDGLEALTQAKVRVANSHYTAKRILAAHPAVGDIAVCHLTLGLNMLNAGAELDQNSTGSQAGFLSRIRPRSILIVGRMMRNERHKGHDQLIEDWPLVRKHVPEAQLVVVGRGDDLLR